MDEGDHEPAQDRSTAWPAPPEGVQLLAEESLGPLRICRYRKRDGRALLLYARSDGADGE
jgi:hypothetical protein